MLIPGIIENRPQNNTSHFILALSIAAAIHGMIIFGVNFGGFSQPDEHKMIPKMEVTLVNSHSDIVPDEFDFLAQTNQQGGGDVQEALRPETNEPPLIPIEAIVMNTPSPPQMESFKEKIDTQYELLTQATGKQAVFTDAMPEEENEAEKLDIAELMSQAKSIATLDVVIGKLKQEHAKMPRRKFISAATKEYKYASYMESWRKKVEKTGNLNFPQEAKRRNLSGSLVLDIAINADGSVRSFKIARSSGHKILDDAALNIVHLAAPFAALPPAILKETDILHITRTWKFLDGDTLSTR